MALIGRSRRRVASDTVPIQDRQRLAKVLKAVVTRLGSQRVASKQLGISQSVLSRIVNEEEGELSRKNVKKLFVGIPAKEQRSLVRSFVVGSSASLRRSYHEWLAEQCEIAARGSARRWFRTPYGLREEERVHDGPGASDREGERQALWRYLGQLSPEFVQDVERSLKKVTDKGYDRLALIRMLDPLINGPDTAFVEPSWREWRVTTKGRVRLLRFVRLGFEREKLMLEVRLPTSERAMNVLTATYEEFMNVYEENAEPLLKKINPFDIITDAYLHRANSAK